jgi:hypothetical protein
VLGLCADKARLMASLSGLCLIWRPAALSVSAVLGLVFSNKGMEMKIIKELWFWFSLLVCPLLALATLSSVPYLVGYMSVYVINIDSYTLKLAHVLSLAMFCLCVGAAVPFISALKQAETRFVG